MNIFAKNIKYLRKRDGVTLSQLAVRLGLGNKSSPHAWETSICYPNIKVLIKISDFFWVSLDDLILTDLTEQ